MMAESKDLYDIEIFKKFSYRDLICLSDGKLLTEDGATFHIHKIELVKSSDYFHRMFCGDIGKGRNEFLIPGISGKVIECILTYVYTGKVHVTEENMCEILVAADYLLLHDLVKNISNVDVKRNLSIKNCLNLFLTALKINQNDILVASYRYVQTNFESIVMVDDSQVGELPLENFKLFLGDKKLRVSGEIVVFRCIVKWVQADPNYRQSLVPDLLMYLKIAEIDEQGAAMIVEHSLIKLNPFCDEINRLRESNSFANLEILKKNFQLHPKPEFALFNRRSPEQFHFIKHQSSVYVTYDENVDLWRKILFLNEHLKSILLIGENIYLDIFLGEIACYSLTDNDFRAMPQFTEHIGLKDYVVLQMNGLIYVLGGWAGIGFHEYNLETASAVEVYDPDTHLWKHVTPMFPVIEFKAISYGGKMYVLGIKIIPGGREIFMQTYHSEKDKWIELPGPTFRCDFKLVGYRRRLYVIGGKGPDGFYNDQGNVQIFDPETEKWEDPWDLPEAFADSNDISVIALNDKLIVYCFLEVDNVDVLSAIQLDEHLKDWIVYDPPWSLGNLFKYDFFTHDNIEMNTVVKQNRESTTKFETSPFN